MAYSSASGGWSFSRNRYCDCRRLVGIRGARGLVSLMPLERPEVAGCRRIFGVRADWQYVQSVDFLKNDGRRLRNIVGNAFGLGELE